MRLMILASTLCLGLLLGTSITSAKDFPEELDVTVLNPMRYVFSGFADAPSPRDGILSMNAACNTLTPGARMCTTEEFWKSPPAIPSDFSGAWIQPEIKSVLVVDEQVVAFDFTGVKIVLWDSGTRGEGSCLQWVSEGNRHYGMAVGPYEGDIQIAAVNCDTLGIHQVTCCAPVH